MSFQKYIFFLKNSLLFCEFFVFIFFLFYIFRDVSRELRLLSTNSLTRLAAFFFFFLMVFLPPGNYNFRLSFSSFFIYFLLSAFDWQSLNALVVENSYESRLLVMRQLCNVRRAKIDLWTTPKEFYSIEGFNSGWGGGGHVVTRKDWRKRNDRVIWFWNFFFIFVGEKRRWKTERRRKSVFVRAAGGKE